MKERAKKERLAHIPPRLRSTSAISGEPVRAERPCTRSPLREQLTCARSAFGPHCSAAKGSQPQKTSLGVEIFMCPLCCRGCCCRRALV